MHPCHPWYAVLRGTAAVLIRSDLIGTATRLPEIYNPILEEMAQLGVHFVERVRVPAAALASLHGLTHACTGRRCRRCCGSVRRSSQARAAQGAAPRAPTARAGEERVAVSPVDAAKLVSSGFECARPRALDGGHEALTCGLALCAECVSSARRTAASPTRSTPRSAAVWYAGPPANPSSLCVLFCRRALAGRRRIVA
jgi:hypothetical protein